MTAVPGAAGWRKLARLYDAHGLRWTRLDDCADIAASASGWDSQMVCFPSVVQAADRRYMFYAGNDHGARGLGCAAGEAAS